MRSLIVTECKSETAMIHTLDIDRIIPKNNQLYRRFEDMGIVSLADSIHRHGILQPISVRRGDEGFIIVAGERRYRAAKLLNLKSIPCKILDTDEKTCAIISTIENIQRREQNIFEEAEAILALKTDYAMTQEELARTLSVSQSYIANKLRLLKFSDEERNMILENRLTERHCRVILRLDNETRKTALNYIILNKLSVLATESYIDKLYNENKKEEAPRLKDLRLFYNSINRAVSSAKRLGVDITAEKDITDERERITIIVNK